MKFNKNTFKYVSRIVISFIIISSFIFSMPILPNQYGVVSADMNITHTQSHPYNYDVHTTFSAFSKSENAVYVSGYYGSAYSAHKFNGDDLTIETTDSSGGTAYARYISYYSGTNMVYGGNNPNAINGDSPTADVGYASNLTLKEQLPFSCSRGIISPDGDTFICANGAGVTYYEHNGDVIWSDSGDALVVDMDYHSNTDIVGISRQSGSGEFTAIDVSTGSRIFTNQTSENNGVEVTDDYIISVDQSGQIIAFDHNGNGVYMKDMGGTANDIENLNGTHVAVEVDNDIKIIRKSNGNVENSINVGTVYTIEVKEPTDTQDAVIYASGGSIYRIETDVSQSPITKTLIGSVIDNEGNDISGVSVTLTNNTYSDTTNVNGEFSIDVELDTYTLNISKNTYYTISKTIDVTNTSDSDLGVFTLEEKPYKITMRVTDWLNHSKSSEYQTYFNGKPVTVDNVTVENTSLVTVNEANKTVVATSNTSLAGETNITANYTVDGVSMSVTKQITVSPLTMEYIDILPPLYATFTVMKTTELQYIFLAIVAGAGITFIISCYAGIGAVILLLIVGWVASWVSLGVVLASLFAGIFIVLQSNIQEYANRIR